MIVTASGPVRGVQRPDGTMAYLGVRYASAARGALPVPEPPWNEVREATAHGPICPQIPGVLERGMGLDADMDEDCLFLSVHVPGDLSADSSRPVLVWIHGGAFETGAGSAPWYDGGALAARYGMVVVTVNYRLGVLGFWRDRNLGLLDQIEALRWVQRHIDAFGGDPARVTVLGESAGGCSVVALLASPLTEGLFHAAWAMSASIGQMRTRERADEVAAHLLDRAGLASEDALFDLDLDRLLEVQRRVLTEAGRSFDLFAPTVGGAALSHDVLSAVARRQIPLVIGTCADEHRLWGAFDPTFAAMDREELLRRLGELFPDQARQVVASYQDHRPDLTPGQVMSAVLTDEAFRSRTLAVAEARSAAGTPTWLYLFRWASPSFGGVLGACHGLDVPFMFQQLDAPGVSIFTGDSADRRLVADAYSGALAHVAERGEAPWSRFDTARRASWICDVTCSVVDDVDAATRSWWQGRPVVSGARAGL